MVNNLIVITIVTFILVLLVWIIVKVVWNKKKDREYINRTGR